MADFNDWMVGTTVGKSKISRIFHKRKDCFIIYELDNSGWFVFDSTGDIGKQFASIQIDWTDITNLLTTKKEKSRYIGKVAGALKECLLGNDVAAKEKLAGIKVAIIDYKTTVGRIEYFIGTLSTFFLSTLILFVVSNFIEPNRLIILKVTFFGVLGGVLSVALNLKSIDINTISGVTFNHIILGSTRIIVSAVSSIVVYVLIKGDLILGVIRDASDYFFYALGVLSGFSEAFIPNLLKKVREQF